jgi:paraquat-inducible protein A
MQFGLHPRGLAAGGSGRAGRIGESYYGQRDGDHRRGSAVAGRNLMEPTITAAQRDGESMAACPDCDLLQLIPQLPPGGKAHCTRCGHLLARQPRTPPEVPLALTIAAVIVFVLANVVPLMDLSVVGRTSSTTIVGGAWVMWNEGEPVTAVLVGFCAVLAPGGYLMFMLALLVAARGTPPPAWVGELLRWANHFQIWSMLEVMMLGILVALVKIAELATVAPGIGMYAVFALMLLIPAIIVTFDSRELWQRVVWAADAAARPPGTNAPAGGAPR